MAEQVKYSVTRSATYNQVIVKPNKRGPHTRDAAIRFGKYIADFYSMTLLVYLNPIIQYHKSEYRNGKDV